MKLIKHSQDFKVLQLRISEDAGASHFIYFKEHAVREHTEDKPSGRTLFIVNVPPYIDEKGLAGAFLEAGNVLSVNFSLKPSSNYTELPKKFKDSCKLSFKIAYIVFEKVSELDKALRLKTLRPVNSKNYQINCGIKKWIQDYNNSVLTTKSLKQKVDEFMSTYDMEVKKADEEKELQKQDSEGWVTITKKGKKQGFSRTENMENKIMAKEEKGRKRKELKNFYTFQIRESKMKHIVALRQKFEEDKKKIAQIKQSRRFKPF